MQIRFLFTLFAALLAITDFSSRNAAAGTLPGRLIAYKKTFDGWWDVACDSAPDGSDARCYVQYVDPYRYPPNLRAAMVDFLYRKSADGNSEPVIRFDVEPDLSFASDVKMSIVDEDGSEKLVPVDECRTEKCVFSGTPAQVMLVRWSGAKLLRLKIKEHSGEVVVRE